MIKFIFPSLICWTIFAEIYSEMISSKKNQTLELKGSFEMTCSGIYLNRNLDLEWLLTTLNHTEFFIFYDGKSSSNSETDDFQSLVNIKKNDTCATVTNILFIVKHKIKSQGKAEQIKFKYIPTLAIFDLESSYKCCYTQMIALNSESHNNISCVLKLKLNEIGFKNGINEMNNTVKCFRNGEMLLHLENEPFSIKVKTQTITWMVVLGFSIPITYSILLVWIYRWKNKKI